MTTIVDLGGEVGKVLCVKGPNSNYENGAEKLSGADIGWFNFNFFSPYSKTPISTSDADQKPIRVRMVFSIVHNTQTSTDEMFKLATSTLANNQTNFGGLFNAGDFQQLDEEGNPVYDENWNVAYDPTKWMVYEFDCTVGTEAGNPTRVKMEFSNGIWMEGAVLIKELTVSGDQVTFNAAGEVYGLNGMKVATAKAGETVQLNAGFYIVRANGESSKLIVK